MIEPVELVAVGDGTGQQRCRRALEGRVVRVKQRIEAGGDASSPSIRVEVAGRASGVAGSMACLAQESLQFAATEAHGAGERDIHAQARHGAGSTCLRPG